MAGRPPGDGSRVPRARCQPEPRKNGSRRPRATPSGSSRRTGTTTRSWPFGARAISDSVSTRRSSFAVCGEAWARIRLGELDSAMSLLEEAAALTVTAGFTDDDRAEVVFQVGRRPLLESRIAEAIVLFDQALILAEGAESSSDRLRSDIFHWRARCHRRNRDWVAAQEDIERALELAEACADTRRVADALFQASLVAQRQGRWVLARTYAERARAVRGVGGQGNGGSAAEQPRRAQPPPRQRRAGDRAARGGVRDLRRARPRGRRGLRLLVARRDSGSTSARPR